MAVTEADSQKPFRFFDLSAELRNTIYTYAVQVVYYDDSLSDGPADISDFPLLGPEEQPAVPQVQDPYFYPYRSPHIPDTATKRPSILSASRQTRREALPLFYALNTFIFTFCPVSKVTAWLLTAIDRNQQARLRSVTWYGDRYCVAAVQDMAILALFREFDLLTVKNFEPVFDFLRDQHKFCEIVACVREDLRERPVLARQAKLMTRDELDLCMVVAVNNCWKKGTKYAQYGAPCMVCDRSEA